ncbi:MAG TPA: hypothetical protein VJM34_09830 [Novosphingobium sp.]|nr:hypothetical protein [Novosphingobium sp.]
MRWLLQFLGILALVMGLLWVGQGLGAVNWPSTSFMLEDREWAVNGAALALVGICLLWLAGRLR